MQIEKLYFSFWDQEKGTVEKVQYKVTFKGLMILEDDLGYAIKKMILHARYKKLLKA